MKRAVQKVKIYTLKASFNETKAAFSAFTALSKLDGVETTNWMSGEFDFWLTVKKKPKKVFKMIEDYGGIYKEEEIPYRYKEMCEKKLW